MTREEHADYVRWLKSLPRRKDHFRMPCPECSATRSNPKDPSFSVHITREGGWAKCFHCDFAIAWNEDEMWKREQKQQDRERQKQQKDAPQHRNTSQHHDCLISPFLTVFHTVNKKNILQYTANPLTRIQCRDRKSVV